jgi:chromosome segregation ATPase
MQGQLTLLEQLQAQVQEQQTLLAHLQSETQTAQKYNARTREEAAAASERQIEDRKKVLAANQRDAENRLKEATTVLYAVKQTAAELEQRKIILEANIAGLDKTIVDKTSVIDETATALELANETLETVEQDKRDVQAEITALKEQAARYSGEKTAFQAEIERLSVKRDAIKAQIDDFTTNWDITLATRRREVGALESKRDLLASEAQQLAYDMTSQREDLARRIMAADERDVVLRRREIIVSRTEAENARNEQLMQL